VLSEINNLVKSKGREGFKTSIRRVGHVREAGRFATH